MKVCYVASSYGLIDEKFISALIGRGHELHVVILKPRILKQEEKMKGAIYHEIPTVFKTISTEEYPSLLYPYHFLKVFLTLKRILKVVKPDVLHGGNVQTAGFLCALTNYHPFLLMPMGSDILLNPKKSKFLRYITKYTINHSNMITCDAESVKKEIISLTRYPDKKIIVFPCGIDLNLFNPHIDSNIREKLGLDKKFIVICTRKHSKVYGIEYLLDAMPKIIKKCNDVSFLMAGTGALTERLKVKVRELKIEDYVKFLGYIPNKKLPEYLVASNVYVSPSLSDGTSISLLEAMACGLPVVVTDVDAILEWVTDNENGVVVPKKNPGALAEAICALLEDDNLRKRFGRKNYKIARERASWDDSVKILEGVFQSLANR